MLVMSQCESKITDSSKFNIEEITTCKHEFISKEDWQKFLKIIQKDKESNNISLKELNGLSEFLGKKMTQNVFVIKEVETKNIFGIFATKEKAKQELVKIFTGKDRYRIKKDNSTQLITLKD